MKLSIQSFNLSTLSRLPAPWPQDMGSVGDGPGGTLDSVEQKELLEAAGESAVIKIGLNDLIDTNANGVMHIGSLLSNVTELFVEINFYTPSDMFDKLMPFERLLALNAFKQLKKVTFTQNEKTIYGYSRDYTASQLQRLAKVFRHVESVVFDRALFKDPDNALNELELASQETLEEAEKAIVTKAKHFSAAQAVNSSAVAAKAATKSRPIVGGIVIGAGAAAVLGGASLFLPMVSAAIADPLLTVIVGTLAAVVGVGAITMGAIKTHATLTGTSLKALFNQPHPKVDEEYPRLPS